MVVIDKIVRLKLLLVICVIFCIIRYTLYLPVIPVYNNASSYTK